MGSGAVASPINCTILIMETGVTMGWNAGTYTGTTNGQADSACNTAGSIPQSICRGSGGTPLSLSFPAQVTTDAAAVGLTLATNCPLSPAGTEVIATYISTASKCTGDVVIDPADCIFGGNSPNNGFLAPTTAGTGSDILHGILLVSPSAGSTSLTFAIDPDQVVGGAGGGVCGAGSAPKFSFHN